LGGTGSTQHGTAGLGTTGNRVQWTNVSSTANGIWFGVDGEGQAVDAPTGAYLSDFEAYSGTTRHAAESGVFAAGTASNSRGNLNTYYAGTFPGGQTAPAAQGQSGALEVGTVGFAWRDVIISRTGDTVEWFIDGLKIATISGASFTANNIFIGLWDSFNSLSDNTNFSFAMFDNVRVERYVTNAPPFITSQPQGLSVTQGSNATFSVTAGGTATLAYQWRQDDTNIAGATQSSYTRNNVGTADAGNYSVFITNVAGTVTSSNALLTVVLPAPLRFDLISLLPDNHLRLTMSGDPGVYALETSTQLTNWSFKTNLTNVTGVFEFVDEPVTDVAQRFYRLAPAP